MRAERWGKIVNVSSMGGRFTFPGGGVYHASKHAVEALSDALRFEVKGFGVDVIIIEPGLIRTSFGETTVREIDAGTRDPGPYGEFNQAVAEATAGVYEQGPLAKLGGPPEAVAKKIEAAITARRPRARYTVTPTARVLISGHSLLGSRGWDAMLSGQFPRPGR
jgi:NAD(P)-dependent dehydrogenase (short-subunit alcohol dehydrogenase family)